MEMGDIPLESMSGVKQALTISNLRRSMKQDKESVTALLDGMAQATAKTMENAVTPHKGGNIDVNV